MFTYRSAQGFLVKKTIDFQEDRGDIGFFSQERTYVPTAPILQSDLNVFCRSATTP
jgi:hypothetical protein